MIPLLDKRLGHFALLGLQRLNDQATAIELNLSLNMRDDLELVLAAQIEMGFPGYIFPLRRPRLELGKEALLPLYPWRALTHLLEYLLKRCAHRGDDFDPRIRVYADCEGVSVAPYQSKGNLAATVS